MFFSIYLIFKYF